MYRVLVPVDGNVDRAVKQASFVADFPGAAEDVRATVMFVPRHQDYQGAPPHEFEELDSAVAAADHLEEAGVSVERVVDGGEVTETILEHAEEMDADMIVVGGRKRSGVAKVLMGSTTQDVVLSSERPVTITG